MASRSPWLKAVSGRLFGANAVRRHTAGSIGKHFVELEQRTVPATFVVTNILDNQADVVGGLSLRQAIIAANANPGTDRIEFNIPRSPSLPTIPTDPTENYFPIVLASTLPSLTDVAGVTIDATTQPRNNVNGTRPIVQLLPDPNPGAFPGSKGALFISGPNNTIRGLVITGFPGSAVNITTPNAANNILVGNWINTDITGTKPWSEDTFIASARPPGTPPELTNTGPNPSKNPLFVLSGITLSDGAHDNIIGGLIDDGGVPLRDASGKLIGTGGTLSRYNEAGVLVSIGINVTAAINRNIISGTPEFKKSYFNYFDPETQSTLPRADDIEGASVGAGVRIQDPGTDRNLIQGNFIGTDVTGNSPIPNNNGIEIFNTSRSNMIGNPTTNFIGDPVQAGVGNLIRFNANDGIRSAQTPNASQIYVPSPFYPNEPYFEGQDALTTTSPGPYGPGGAAAFFDALNPNYFIGVSAAGPNIITIGLDSATPGISAQPGETVTLRGSGLLSTTAVTFDTAVPGETITAKFVVINDSEVRITVPATAASGLIHIFTPAGTDIAATTILPSPPVQIEITSLFSPSSGLAGTIVQIFGDNFTGAQSVSFGGILATQYTVLAGGKQIDAVVPTGALTGNITVTTPGGATVTTRAFRVLTQPPPIVSTVSSTTALPGQEIVLTGNFFTGAYLVRFNYTGGPGGFATTKFVVDSPNQIRVTVPALATASAGLIQVVSNDGFGVSPVPLQILTPAAPVVTGISSNSGPIGTMLTITGSNFTSATRVTVSGVDMSKFTIVNDSTITGNVPAGVPIGSAGVVRVISTGGAGLSPTNFTPTPSLAPTVADIPFAIRNTFTVVNGTNLLGTSKVLFGNAVTGTPAPFVEVISDTQIRIQIPPSAPNSGKFFIFTPYNTQNPLAAPASANFTLQPSVAPSIGEGRQTDPISGVVGSKVTLRGQGFYGTQNVFFTASAADGGEVPANNLVIVSDSEINFTVPLQAITGRVRVDTPGVPDTDIPFDAVDLIHVTSINYTVLASPTPVITGSFPSSGVVGQELTINGSGFTGTVQVTVGGAVADDFTVFSDTLILVRVPLLAQNGPVTVLTPAVIGLATAPGSFSIVESPAAVLSYSSPRAARNTQITIAGTGLAGTQRVQFNEVDAEFTVISDGLVTAIVPIGAGPGEIRVTTVAGQVISPTPFEIDFVQPPILQSVGGRQASENQDAGPVGSFFFINGVDLNSVFRVEIGGASAKFNILSADLLQVTIPEMEVGTYSISVFASTIDDTDPGNTGLGTNGDTSFVTATNILGTTFTYGEQLTVLPNPRPVVTGISADDNTFVRGAPVTIQGRGFLGANLVQIGGVDITPDIFDVISDTEISVRIPVADLAGVDKLNDTLVRVFTPNGVPGDATDDLGSIQTGPEAQIDIPASDPLTFDAIWDPIFLPDGTFYGSNVVLFSITGNFYGVSSLSANSKDANGDNADLGTLLVPMFQPISARTPQTPNFTITPGFGGAVAQAIVPTGFTPIPDGTLGPLDPPDSPVPPPGALISFIATTNAGDVVDDPTTELLANRPETPSVTFVGSLDGNDAWNTRWVIAGGPELVSTNIIIIDGTGGPIVLRRARNQFEYSPDVGGIIFTMPTIRNPLLPIQTVNWPTGSVTVLTPEGEGSGSFTPVAQPVPAIFAFSTRDDPPQDNRFFANRIFDNGLTINRDANNIVTGVTIRSQATQLEDGNLGIDFVTQLPGAGTFPFNYGYGYLNQSPPTAPPPGNQGRGGLDDGTKDSFSLQTGISKLPSDPAFADFIPGGVAFDATIADGSYTVQGQNTFNNQQYGRYFGPNLLQNFPLLQVVQSSVDRTTFSTALIAKPYRTYRIDYYYDPGLDNPISDTLLDPFLASQSPLFTGTRFDDDDPTARATTNVGYGQIYLGSKLITTNGTGDGSVSFPVYKRLPTDPNDPNSIPPLAPGEFQLPNNEPLKPSRIDPITGAILFKAGVVTATATDLTAPPPQGAIVTAGPDGTSRLSFFKRVDTPTGSIGGRVIIDKNADGIIQASEQGLTGATVGLFVQQETGLYSTSPNAIATIASDGGYLFGTNGTGGYGIPNGKHRLVLTLPTGGSVTYFYEVPVDGIRTPTIISGENVTSQDFLVTTTPTGTNTPPTISDIPNQNVPINTTIGPVSFTIGDLETPASSLTLSVTSSNPSVAPPGGISFGGSGANRTVTVIPAAGVSGSSTIVVTVTDGSGLTASDTFVVNVGVPASNTPPTITDIPNQTIPAGSSSGPISFTIGDAETPPANLTLLFTTSNPTVIPLSAITVSGTGAIRNVTVNAPLGVSGSSTITMTVTDGGGLSASDVFTVTIPPPPGTAPNLLVIGSDAGTVASVNVYNPNGNFLYNFKPFGPNFTGGVRVSTGDVTGDGNADVIVAPGPGMEAVVKVYEGVSGAFLTQFLAYENFTGGIYVVTGDVDADGIRDIITGTGRGGGPRVRALSGGMSGGGLSLNTLADFFAYESTFRGGVLVASGDVNNDGHADFITGTGVDGGPRVRVVDGVTLNTIYDFFAYENRFRGGVFASVGDVDGDGQVEIITGTGVGGGPIVKIFKQASLLPGALNPVTGQATPIRSFAAYDPSFRGGVRVDGIDANSDGIVDIVTAPGPGLPADVRVINYATLQDIYRIQAFDATFRGGVFVGGNV